MFEREMSDDLVFQTFGEKKYGKKNKVRKIAKWLKTRKI